MPIRAMLIDDEEPARVRLRGLLEQFDDLDVVDEARDGEEAVRKIADVAPDLIFLDIQMPGLSGMEVAARLSPPRPRIIFCTAFDQYAIQAFEQHATDYLLKPVNRARLAQAIDRVRGAVAEQQDQRREDDDAKQVQARLYPQRLPPMRTLDYWGTCRPARAVGGDYYDFLPIDERRLGIATGDVSGKGMFAGLLMAGLQARIQSIAPRVGTAIEDLVAEVNRAMLSTTEINRYATFFYGLYDDATRGLSYVNAGHLPPIVLRPDPATGGGGRSVRHLATGGTVVGLLPEARYRRSELQLQPGDLFCVYTDGVTEALSPSHEEFGAARLEDALGRHARRPAREVCAALLDEIHAFTGGRGPDDDLTLIVGQVR